MIVYFVRHASAGQHKASPEKDEKRPIDREGVRQAHQIGRLLAALNVEVELVLSSPLKRAMQTASLVANEIGYEQKIERATALRPEATFDSFRRVLSDYAGKDAIMLVGHNPSITEFLSRVLSRGEEYELVDFKKGAVARVEMTGRKSGTLHWCITPKIASAAYEAANPRPSRSRANGTRPAPEANQKPKPPSQSGQKVS
jgi:phosphohistidine phosphatase